MSRPSPVPLRAVVIGGSGQIGGWLTRVLAERGHSVVGTYATTPFPGLIALDAARLDESAAWLAAQHPDVVFYPAGFTWVDGCERDPDRAYSANLHEPLNLARAAAAAGARFVSFSTDYVFDGLGGPYAEDAPTHPLSIYGKAKRAAEEALDHELGDRALVVRTSWVYGPERQGKNFAYQLARTLQAGRELVCPVDQISSPAYGPDIARAAVMLAEEHAAGLIHVVGPEILDRVSFAQKIAEAFGLDPDLIKGAPTVALAQGAPRPLKSGLLTRRLDAWSQNFMRSLDQALADFQSRLASPDPDLTIKPVL